MKILKLKTTASLFGILIFSSTAWAQTESIASITSAANNGTDKSMSVLQQVFGSIATAPFSSSAGSTSGMLGSIFLTLNVCMLAVGGLWAMYHFVTALVATGADGEFMGAKRSGLWFVLRNAAGFAGLVPIVGGYSIAQTIMMWSTMMGVGIANLLLAGTLTVLSAGGSMVSTPAAPLTTALAKSLFESNLCAQAVNKDVSNLTDDAGVTADAGETFSTITATGKVVLMNQNGLSCGGAQINPSSTASSSATTTTSLASGLTAYATDTSSVASSLLAAQQTALTAMQATLSSAAQTYVTAVNGQKPPADPEATINQAAQTYQTSIQAAISSSSGAISGLSSTIQSNLTRDGWIMLGAWYQTFAQANSQLSSLASATATAVPATGLDNLPYSQLYETTMTEYQEQIEQDASTSVPSASTTTGTATTGSALSSLFPGTDPESVLTGIFPGQRLVNEVISLTSSAGQSGASSTTAVNPLIGMKNLGDYILDAGWASLGAYAAVKGLEGATGSTLGKFVSKALNIGTGGLSGAALGALKGVADAVGPLVLMMVIALFFFGVMLSVYLPMLPFIIWFGGILSWFVVVCEAMVASPLWAFAHLDGDGEGMGQRTTHGYIFILNLMLRPTFMVLGFLLAGGGVVALGTLLNTMFSVAMTNAQYNSTTGLVSIIAYIVLYVGMCQTLCHTLFGLIHVIPDQAFAWIGGQMGPRLGQDMHQQTNVAFGAAVRQASSAAAPMARGGGQRQEKPLPPGDGE